MQPQIELHLLNDRLKIISVKKSAIHKLAFPIFKIAFTNKTECKYFSFNETNEDYTIIIDNFGLKELRPFFDKKYMSSTDENWIPMILSGEDLPGAMSITKISKYVIIPLADQEISIMAISMYQSDYILIQEKDYVRVIDCLSNYIPKIFDEAISIEKEIEFKRKKYDSKSIDVEKKNHKISQPLIMPEENEYCITGLYNQDAFILIIPTLIDIMFYETENYENEIFFNFIKKESDISLVMETRLLKKFPTGALVNVENDYWKLIRIGLESVGIEIFGVCASISQPLEKANVDEYYISSYHSGYCFIPSDKLVQVRTLFEKEDVVIVQATRATPVSDLASSSSDSNEHLTNSDENDLRNSSSIENDLNVMDSRDELSSSSLNIKHQIYTDVA